MSQLQWQLPALELALRRHLPDLTVQWLAQIDSSNTELMRRHRRGENAPVLLLAEQQSAGRGRMGRAWLTPAGSALTFSVGLVMNPLTWAGLSLAVGVVLAEALDPDRRLGIGLKWPNDLWHWPQPGPPTKLGGILIETLPLPATAKARYCIVGVGINLKTPEIDTGLIKPIGIDHWGEPAARGAILAQLALPLIELLAEFPRQGPQAWLTRYASRDLLRGQALQTSRDQQGVGAGIDGEGALLIDTANGLLKVDSADISVRPVKI